MPPAEHGGRESRSGDLIASAREARSRAQQAVLRAQAIHRKTEVAWREYERAWARSEWLRELWLSGERDRLRYSALARLQARMASMPLIEQAKGVLMAQCGWTGDQAFDVLRKASQRSNIRVRELAAKIVADTARAPAQPGTLPRRHASQPIDGPVATVHVLPTSRSDDATTG